MAAATTLTFPLRVLTYQTMIPLLAVTGMRVGEVIRLNRKDVVAFGGQGCPSDGSVDCAASCAAGLDVCD